MSTINYTKKQLVHLKGSNDLSISHDGRYIITGGGDSFIRVFDSEKLSDDSHDAEIGQLELHQKEVTCVSATHPEYFATCSSDCSAVLFGSPPRCTYIHHLTRSTLPISQLSFHPNGHDIAIASEDGTIKILSIQSPADDPLLINSKQPIYSVSFDPLGRYLASLDKSGSLTIWNAQKNFSTQKIFPAISGTVNRHASTNASSIPFPRVTWSLDGAFIAVPSEIHHSIKIIDALLLKEICSFGSDQHRKCICCISWAPKSSYRLASSSSDGVLCIWEFTNNIATLMSKFIHPERTEFISSIAWTPNSMILFTMDSAGQLMQFNNHFSHDVKKEVSVNALEKSYIELEADQKIKDLFSDSQPSKKQKIKYLKRHEDLENKESFDEYYDYDIEDDMEYQTENLEIVSRKGTSECFFQPPFQPCSTFQYQKSNSSRYFLAYNMTGYIIHRDDGRQTMIDIEFHDKTLYRPIHFVNQYGFHLASMSDRGALFASETTNTKNDLINTDHTSNRSEDSILPGTIHYVPFESWSPNSDWIISLENEVITSIGLSKKWAITVSENHYVRVFTFSGIQRWLFCLPGDIVTMAVQDDVCFFVYHSEANSKEQKLLYMLYNLDEQSCAVYGDPLPLSKKSLLKWIGFCQGIDGHMPACMDTRGIVRILNGRLWIPVLDTSKLQNDNSTEHDTVHYWPVGLTRDHMTCVVVKGDCYPSCVPRPILTNISLDIPLLQSAVGQTNKLEAKLLHDTLFKLSDSIAHDKMIFELIRNAMEQDRLVRALDLCLLLSSDKSFSLVIQLAQMYKLSSLAERMELLRQARKASLKSGQESFSKGYTLMAQSSPEERESTEQDMNNNIQFNVDKNTKAEVSVISQKSLVSEARSASVKTQITNPFAIKSPSDPIIITKQSPSSLVNFFIDTDTKSTTVVNETLSNGKSGKENMSDTRK